MSLALALLAPPASGTGASVSTTMLVIIGAVVVVGAFIALGWRSPDRSPKIEEKVEREEQE